MGEGDPHGEHESTRSRDAVNLSGSSGPKPQPAAPGVLFLPPGPGSPSHWDGVSQVPKSCVGFPRHDLSARAPGPWGVVTPVGLGQGPARPSGRALPGRAGRERPALSDTTSVRCGQGPRPPLPSTARPACCELGFRAVGREGGGTQPQPRLRDPVHLPSVDGGRREP